jgi:hypothetical protein
MSAKITNSTIPEPDPGWMTKKELCNRWKQCAKTVERRVSEGKLKVHRFGNRSAKIHASSTCLPAPRPP